MAWRGFVRGARRRFTRERSPKTSGATLPARAASVPARADPPAAPLPPVTAPRSLSAGDRAALARNEDDAQPPADERASPAAARAPVPAASPTRISSMNRRLSLDGDLPPSALRPDAASLAFTPPQSPSAAPANGSATAAARSPGTPEQPKRPDSLHNQHEEQSPMLAHEPSKSDAQPRPGATRPLGMSVLADVAGCSKAGWEPARAPAPGEPVEVRKENQDAFCIYSPFAGCPDQVFLGVFDGHGAEGRSIAHYVRDNVPRVLDTVARQNSLVASRSAENAAIVTRAMSGAGAQAPDGTGTSVGGVPPESAGVTRGGSEHHATPAHSGTEVHKAIMHALKAAFSRAERDLMESDTQIDHVFSGTTAVVTWFFANHAYTAWAGDSRAVVGRAENGSLSHSDMHKDGSSAGATGSGNRSSNGMVTISTNGSPGMGGRYDSSDGSHPPETLTGPSPGSTSKKKGDRGARFRAIELSHDQKPARPDEKRRVKAAGGRIARWRRNIGPLRVWLPKDWIPGLAMTRSIGDTVLSDFGVSPVPEVSYTQLTPNDVFIVLASDGVWEFMDSQVVVDFVGRLRREGKSAEVAAESLVREAVRRWRRNEVVVDDTTAVVMWLDCGKADALTVSATGSATSASLRAHSDVNGPVRSGSNLVRGSSAASGASPSMTSGSPLVGQLRHPMRRLHLGRSPSGSGSAESAPGIVSLILETGRLGSFACKNDVVG